MRRALRPANWTLALEALGWLTLAWLLVDVLPGHAYTRLLPASGEAEASTSTGVRTPQIQRVSHGVIFVSRRLPFRSECLHRAIAAHRMLRRRGVPTELHFGIAPAGETGKLQSHVWATSHGADVVGTAEARGYTRVGSFPLAATASARRL